MTHNLTRQFRPHAAEGQPGRDWFLPLSGWLLTSLVKLEEDSPGTLLFAFKSGVIWRNAVAVALATGALDHPESFLLRAYGELDDRATAPSLRAQFAQAIQIMKPQQIVEAALAEVPPSLMGALKKIGSEPLTTAEAYTRLIALLGSTTSEGRTRRRVLEQVNVRLTDDLLQVVETIDLAILTPTVATHVSDACDAHRLNARLRAIRLICSAATDDALRTSADAMGGSFNSSQFARSWLSKADRLEPLGLPIDDADDVVRINPATAEATGRRWRNCIAAYRHEMAAGASAFFAVESLHVIVMLRLTDAGWLLTGVYTHDNGPVHRTVIESVKKRLGGLGVLCILPVRPQGEVAMAAGVFSRVDDLEFDFDGMDG